MGGVLLALLLAAPLIAPGQIVASEESGSEESAGHGEMAGHEELESRHHSALFVGNTHKHGEDELTWGLEYYYAVHPKIRFGGMVEYAGGDFRDWLFLGLAVWRPVANLLVIGGPGFELHENHREFAFRVGVGYKFPIGRFAIVPNFNVDFIDGEEVKVYGVAFEFEF
jgi:hypothetical protein